MIRGATYETDYDKPKAVEALTGGLTDKDNTIAHLAEASNAAYHFFDETEEAANSVRIESAMEAEDGNSNI